MAVLVLTSCEAQIESQIRTTLQRLADNQEALLSSDKMHIFLLGTGGPISNAYGPEGVEQVVGGYNTAYALDSSYRTAHHTEEWMPPKNSDMTPHTVTIPEPKESVPFFDRNDLRISVFQVDHSPVHPAVGYRFEYRGNVVVISGDTVKTPTLAKFAKDADLFLCEALNKEMITIFSRITGEENNPRLSRQMLDVLDYHMTPVEAAEVAQEARVKTLVLVHIVPPLLQATKQQESPRSVP